MNEFDPIDPTVFRMAYADAARSVRHIFVRDYVTDAEIGVWDHEKGDTQVVRLNIDLSVHEQTSHHADNIENVVCYNQVIEGIEGIILQGHINLVETLAENIAAMALRFNNVVSVRVRVEKLEAVKKATSVGVEIERHRMS